jgi:hypothetical protein
MHTDDGTVARLRKALAQVAADDAGDLLAEARVAAQDHVRSLLRDALSQALLEEATGRIEAGRWLAGAAQEAGPRTMPGPVEPEMAAASRAPSNVAAPVTPSAPSDPPGPDAFYVYGIVEAGVQGLAEPAGGAVDFIVEDGVAAVTTRVPLDEFEEEALRTHLGDLEWVEATARRHEHVLDTLCAQTTVIPMRMCTVYRTEGGVREMLVREAEVLREALLDLSGKSEWGVKVFAHQVPPDSLPAESEGTRESEPRGEGANYLARLRHDRDLEARVERLVAEAAGEIHECLMTLSCEGRAHPPQRAEAGAHGGDLVLSGVYLVKWDAAEAFHREVAILGDRFAAVGVELVETGPWPPYNFLPGPIGAAW